MRRQNGTDRPITAQRSFFWKGGADSRRFEKFARIGAKIKSNDDALSCRYSCRGLRGCRLGRRRGVRRGCCSARLGHRGEPWGSVYLRHTPLKTTAYSIDATLSEIAPSFPSPGKNGSQVLRALLRVCFAQKTLPRGSPRCPSLALKRPRRMPRRRPRRQPRRPRQE